MSDIRNWFGEQPILLSAWAQLIIADLHDFKLWKNGSPGVKNAKLLIKFLLFTNYILGFLHVFVVFMPSNMYGQLFVTS